MRHHGFSCSSLYTVTPEQAQENLLIDFIRLLKPHFWSKRPKIQIGEGIDVHFWGFSPRLWRLTPGMSCCRKRKRSGRWRQSAPGPCWAFGEITAPSWSVVRAEAQPWLPSPELSREH